MLPPVRTWDCECGGAELGQSEEMAIPRASVSEPNSSATGLEKLLLSYVTVGPNKGLRVRGKILLTRVIRGGRCSCVAGWYI
jgi:hypothetical protein